MKAFDDDPRDHGPWKVSEVAALAGVSVRTLHHYDQIGLLCPASTTQAGYRLYAWPELEKLQQILFYREIGFPLENIKRILKGSSFDRLEALVGHKRALERRRQRLDALLATIDRTIKSSEGENAMSAKELFSGFDIDAVMREQEGFRQEVEQSYDPALVAESRRRVAKYTKPEMGRILAEQAEIAQAMAKAKQAGVRPGDKIMQELVARHRQFIDNKFYPCSLEVYTGLGQLYVNDPRFATFWNQLEPGLAAYVSEAIADHVAKARG